MPRNRERYPDKLMPSAELRAAWRLKGDMLEDDGYDQRWLRFWRATLDMLRDQETWDGRDVRLLAEYVEWHRLATDHQQEAEANPYRTHAESGRIYVHPGFAQARDALREAREVGRELGVGPDGRAAAGLSWRGPDGEGSDADESDQAGL